MKELVRANKPALLSFVQSLLRDAEIEFILTDEHASIMDGSIGALPRRILVADDDFDAARQIMHDADIGDEISRTHNKS
ncbi:DUF2007 domain-containing protein [Hyphococcus sp.]|uniref:putative signal transducing protein n=1 Tax=Hyphococcus sp. TaxID=2038636 RepID=UPI002088E380|nr:MAG: hypothetical protein DHS20C04_25180 [Marinicaulis sp.]